MEDQIASAVNIAADPSQDRALRTQAVDFLNAVRSNAKDGCATALSLFLEQNADGTRKHTSHVRLFALQLLDDFLDNITSDVLDPGTFQALEQAFVMYIQSEYTQGAAESQAPFIRNKFSHTLALFFLRTYPEQWQNFFPTIYSLLRPAHSAGNGASTNGAGAPPINPHVSVLFLRLLIEISGEVHDQTLRGARTWSEERGARDAKVRQTIRENEAENMNTAVLTIISEAEERLVRVREQPAGDPARGRERTGLEEVVELGVRAFAGYCQWIDINLIVNQHTVPLIFRLLADPSSPIRQATAYALLKIVTKGLREPSDKLQLIRVLSLGEVLDALEDKSRTQREGGTASQSDEAEETYRESLGKLACGLGTELVELIGNEGLASEGRAIAEQLLLQLLPVAIRFLADEYDDTSSTIFPLFSAVFGSYKKAKKLAPLVPISDTKRDFLTETLKVLIQKMKWDTDIGTDEDDFEDMDDDDKGTFEKMRHDLRSLVDSILVIDEALVTEVTCRIALETLSQYQQAVASGNAANVPWQEVELAVYLVYLFGELRTKGKFVFVHIPPELAADKAKRKAADLSQFPLTPLGELMMALVQTNVSSYPHIAVRNQYFETVGRYIDFFRVRKDCVVSVLESLVDQRGMHHPKKNRRGRIFYIFYRFVKECRTDIPQQLLHSLLGSIQDLLQLETELPPPDTDNQSNSSAGSSPTPDQDANAILEEAVRTPTIFDNQLYLFETTGILISGLTSIGEDEQVALLQAVVDPLMRDLASTLQTPLKDSKDVLPVFRAHHLIQALSSVAKGLPDAPPTWPEGAVPKRVDVLRTIADAVVVSLDTFGIFKVIRDATRFAFTRLIAVAGMAVAQYIPTLTSRLLSVETDSSEIVELFSFLGLVFHRHLGDEVLDMLDQLISPMTTKVLAIISRPADGTDARQAQEETKRAYLDFILVIMSGSLYAVFISPRNAPQFESLVGGIIQLAADTSYPPTQRTAFMILARFTTHFGAPEGSTVVIKNAQKSGNKDEVPAHYVPGFERVIYDRLIPLAFSLPTAPGFNVKDGQTVQVLGEIANFLGAAHKARGQEVLEFLANQFLPSQNSPPETTLDFVTKLRDLDDKGFRKYFTDFVRGSASR